MGVIFRKEWWIMDDLFTNSINFIFKPESVFSVLFLIVFIICFVYGIWLKRSCLNYWVNFESSAERDYKLEREHFLPDVFVNLKQEQIAALENKMTDLPNLFVTIGILGTFIGLGVAIQSAATLLNDENIDLSKLNAMLGVIAFKFQISVWGTIFSIIFQKIVMEFYFEKKQHIITNVLSSLYSNEINVRTTMEKQLGVTQNINIASGEQLGLLSDSREIYSSQLSCLNHMQNNFEHYVDVAGQFVENVKRFGNNVDKYHNDFIEALHRSSNLFAEGQKKLEDSISKCVDDFISNVKVTADMITAGQARADETQMQLHSQIVHSIERLQKLFVRGEDEYVKKAQEEFNRMMKNSMKGIHDTYLRAASKLDSTVDKLSKELESVESRTEAMHQKFTDEQEKFIDNHNNTFNTIKKMMEDIDKMESEHQGRILECYQNMKNIWTSMDKDAKSNSKEFKDFINSVQDKLKVLCDNVTDGQNEYANAIKIFNEKFGEEAKSHIEKMEQINSTLNEIITENKNVTKCLKNMPMSLMNIKLKRNNNL